MLSSAFIQSLVNFITKVLLRDYPDVGTITANFFRGLILMIFSLVYFRIKHIGLLTELKKNFDKTLILLARCFFGASAHILLYEANKYMRISSSVVIFSTYPIIASFIIIFVLKVKVTSIQLFTYIACFCSVILISKPSFLFPSNEINEDSPLGVLIAMMSSVWQAIGTLLNKPISLHFDVTISTFMYGLIFSLDSLILGIYSGSFLKGFCMLEVSFILILLLGAFYYYSLIHFVQALNIGDPIKVLPFTYIGIILNSFYNVCFFGGSIDFLDIVGSLIIIVVNIWNNILQLKR